jgi:hypothetical protein
MVEVTWLEILFGGLALLLLVGLMRLTDNLR